MRQLDYYKKALTLLEKLHKQYPSFELGRHISTAFADYGETWGLTGKEFYFALEKYAAELEMDDMEIASDDYVERIVRDANSMFTSYNESDEDEDDNN